MNAVRLFIASNGINYLKMRLLGLQDTGIGLLLYSELGIPTISLKILVNRNVAIYYENAPLFI
jgi:hypothetical protein